MELSASLRKKAQPWRGGPIPFAPVDLKKVGSRLREVRGLDALQHAILTLQVTIDPPFRASLQKRVDGPVDQPEEIMPEVEAAMLCLLGANDHAWDRAHEIGADMVHLWCSKGSVATAIRALLLNAEYDGSGKRSRNQKFQAFFPYVGPWRALRAYLAHAPEADYLEALAVARERAWDQVAWLAAHAFPTETDFVHKAVEEVLTRPPALRGIGLLAAVDNPVMFSRLADHLKNYLGNDYIGIKIGDFLPATVARLGNDSFEGLRVLAEAASKAGEKKMLAELMSELTHPAVGPWLTARIKDKAFGPAAHAYQAKSEPVATPSAPASADEPDILRRPPWLHRVAKATPLQLSLEVAPFAEVVHFGPGRKEYILENTKGRNGAESQRWMEYYRNQPRKQFFPEELCELQDRDWALRQWNESPAERWNPCTLRSTYWMTVPERMLAVFGPDSMTGLLATLSVAPDVNYAGLSLVESPRLAAAWAEAWATKKKFRKLASNWFLRFPRAGALGLLPAALGTTGKVRNHCQSVIRWMDSKGQGQSLRQAAAEYGASRGLEHILAYDALQELPTKMPPLPAWFRPEKCQAPRTQTGVSLSPGALANLALMVAISTLDAPYAGLAQLQCESTSLQRFALSTYEQWLKTGGPPKEDWGFRILAYFGGDEAARRIAPDLRRWPGEGLSGRASVGLDILRFLGSDVALTHLHGIALKVRFKALQEKAQQHIQEIADERGLSVDELADRLVPDLDLEADGSRPLGSYRVTFDELLRPRLRDEAGRELADLPKTSPAEVAEVWKSLKKDAKAVASVQLERLEQALTCRRRWSAEVFRRLLVEHPLLIHLVQRLVWGVYRDDTLLQTFRVAEDRSFANLDEVQIQVDDGSVGIFHPLDDPEQVKAWKALLSDYQILQPFPQLDRSIHARSAGLVGHELAGFRGVQVTGGHLLSLENRGWRRGQVESGCLLDMTRGSFRLELDDGLPVEAIAGSTVTLGKLYSEVPLEELHPVTICEMLRDLESLRQKAVAKG
ncbi:DUF4132 domain-containing protein [bacterium]|nr:DUF4132 domain-containing protein [bacterium]